MPPDRGQCPDHPLPVDRGPQRVDGARVQGGRRPSRSDAQHPGRSRHRPAQSPRQPAGHPHLDLTAEEVSRGAGVTLPDRGLVAMQACREEITTARSPPISEAVPGSGRARGLRLRSSPWNGSRRSAFRVQPSTARPPSGVFALVNGLDNKGWPADLMRESSGQCRTPDACGVG
jgi:hypothetical protein